MRVVPLLFGIKGLFLIATHRLIELQAFLSTLVGNFEFAMTDKTERIVRQTVLIVAPMVEGEFDRGVQMPMAVSLAQQDAEP